MKFVGRMAYSIFALCAVAALIYGLSQFAAGIGMNGEHRGPATFLDMVHAVLMLIAVGLVLSFMLVLALLMEIVWGFNPKQLVNQEKEARRGWGR